MPLYVFIYNVYTLFKRKFVACYVLTTSFFISTFNTFKKCKSVKIWQNYGHESVARFFGPPCIDSSVATVAISRDERRDTLLAVNHTVNYFDKHRQRQNRKTAKRISFRRFIACLQANVLNVAEIRTRSIRRLTFLAPCAALHCVAASNPV